MLKSPFREKIQRQKDLEQDTFYNKKVEYYSQVINAWLTTTMEKDKTILTLSTAGLGVLVTFFNNISINYNLIFYILALLSFIIAIHSGIKIFSENAEYCQSIITGNKYDKTKLLKCLDKRLINSFYCGIIFSIILSSIFIYEKNIKEKDTVVSEKNISSLKKESMDTVKLLELELTKIKEIEIQIEEAKKVKLEIEQNINKLSKELKILENINSLKEERKIIETKINNYNIEINEKK